MNKQTEQVFHVRGEELLQKVKELINEGNIRKIGIQDKEGKVIAEFPLTIGVAGAILAPVFVAVGAIAALVTECSIVVTKETK